MSAWDKLGNQYNLKMSGQAWRGTSVSEHLPPRPGHWEKRKNGKSNCTVLGWGTILPDLCRHRCSPGQEILAQAWPQCDAAFQNLEASWKNKSQSWRWLSPHRLRAGRTAATPALPTGRLNTWSMNALFIKLRTSNPLAPCQLLTWAVGHGWVAPGLHLLLSAHILNPGLQLHLFPDPTPHAEQQLPIPRWTETRLPKPNRAVTPIKLSCQSIPIPVLKIKH